MIKIAFIKFGGMANGGTEKYLQTIAAYLPKDQFKVDFYYCDAAPYIGSDYKHIDTDLSRVEYVKSHGVNLIKFDVQYKNVTVPTHDWINTNFWEFFNENNYDIIQTARSGHPEYPFIHIHNTPIVDSIHLAGMAEEKPNIYKTVLISEEQKQKWISAGGNPNKAIIIPVAVEIPNYSDDSYIKEYNWENKFIFGMHQRNDDNIFSEIPLEAYKKIESDETAFLILGGSKKYKEQADSLKIKNIKFIDSTSNILLIHKFLNTLDVYAHGRKDGEQCSSSIIEGLSHSLPIVSHVAPSMGHAEQIKDAGVVVKNAEEYACELKKLMIELEYKKMRSENAKKIYKTRFNITSIIDEYIKLYKKIILK